MTQLERERTVNEEGRSIVFRFHGNSPTGPILSVEAEFLPHNGRAVIKFESADNMAAALEEITETIKDEANRGYWEANPHAPLRIDIVAGRFETEIAQIAPRLGFEGPKPAGEFGTESQYTIFSAEFFQPSLGQTT